MAASKLKSIPSWQMESKIVSANTTEPEQAQNDDSVYAQAQPAEESPANSKTAKESASSTPNDDPVYAQSEAVTSSSAEQSNSEQNAIPDDDQSQATTSSSSDLNSTESDPSLRARSSLLASASKFLKHEDLAMAPLERKIAFLQEKGLTKEEIDGLLTPSTSTSATQASPAPPIITYPEFLSHAHRPKPLVTRSRIVNAVYATGMISGALYLANRYIFEPMAGEMAAARHELFSTAQKGVEGLNERLEKNVRVVPPVRRHGAAEEADSVASDPDELFHRDIGVQTSPKMEGLESTENASGEDGAVEQAKSSLQELRSQMQILSKTIESTQEEEDYTMSAVSNLQAYLDGLAYGSQTSLDFSSGYTNYGSRPDASKMDEIAKFKAEIRSVKGALLSARNFPASSVARAR